MKGRIIVSLKTTKVLDAEADIIAHPHTCGIILFQRNYKVFDIEGLKRLIAHIQLIALKANKKNGLPIFVDQEGGHIQRLGRGFTKIPSSEVYGVTYDLNVKSGLKLAHYYGHIMAKELAELGIISIAPSVDLHSGNSIISGLNRAFHKDPDKCYQIAESFINGMFAANMPATLKHFPGHGSKDIADSHLGEIIDRRSLNKLEQTDLIPFIKLLQNNNVKAVMPAHITFSKIDPNNTVGNSEIWLNDLLRGKYNFNGIIISDCLSMAGSGSGSYVDKIDAALAYGDIALLSNLEPEALIDTLNHLSNKHFMSKQIKTRFEQWVQHSITNRIKLAKKYAKTALESVSNSNTEILNGSKTI